MYIYIYIFFFFPPRTFSTPPANKDTYNTVCTCLNRNELIVATLNCFYTPSSLPGRDEVRVFFFFLPEIDKTPRAAPGESQRVCKSPYLGRRGSERGHAQGTESALPEVS